MTKKSYKLAATTPPPTSVSADRELLPDLISQVTIQSRRTNHYLIVLRHLLRSVVVVVLQKLNLHGNRMIYLLVSSGVEPSKPRDRPPSGRAIGRERKPAVVSAPASVFPYVANSGVRRRGRPKRVDAGASSVAPPPQPNNNGSVARLGLMLRRTEPGYYPWQYGLLTWVHSSETFVGDLVDLVKYFGHIKIQVTEKEDTILVQDLITVKQCKAKEIVDVLKAQVGGIENQVAVQAIYELEELTRETTDELQHLEEVQPAGQHPEGHGQGHAQSEAEYMQEALF
ncbi:hypothetical protein Bca52824_017391 [Brassica carinata]|uniref:Uncharacterized protein n=1 Tax=Brassica carinata TaxID=52824 RepID=A0A8X7VN44_BRACI|nr:hypothetical protein Bca52824_017391 [Brassica carinata]